MAKMPTERDLLRLYICLLRDTGWSPFHPRFQVAQDQNRYLHPRYYDKRPIERHYARVAKDEAYSALRRLDDVFGWLRLRFLSDSPASASNSSSISPSESDMMT